MSSSPLHLVIIVFAAGLIPGDAASEVSNRRQLNGTGPLDCRSTPLPKIAEEDNHGEVGRPARMNLTIKASWPCHFHHSVNSW
jgi:hypothetical protein